MRMQIANRKFQISNLKSQISNCQGPRSAAHCRAKMVLPFAVLALTGILHTTAPITASAAQITAQQRAPDPLSETQVVSRVTTAVDRALEYLASKQNPDGSWNAGNGRNNAIVAVALLAFMGRGHVLYRGPYRDVLDRGRTFNIGNEQTD